MIEEGWEVYTEVRDKLISRNPSGSIISRLQELGVLKDD